MIYASLIALLLIAVGFGLLLYGISHGGQNSGYGKPSRWSRR